MILKTYIIAFDDIIIKFTIKNGRTLKKKTKLIWHGLLINRNEPLFYRTKNKKIQQLYAAKTASKRVVNKLAEATGELIENKIAKNIANPKSVSDENSGNFEEIAIPPEKRQKKNKQMKTSILK